MENQNNEKDILIKEEVENIIEKHWNFLYKDYSIVPKKNIIIELSYVILSK